SCSGGSSRSRSASRTPSLPRRRLGGADQRGRVGSADGAVQRTSLESPAPALLENSSLDPSLDLDRSAQDVAQRALVCGRQRRDRWRRLEHDLEDAFAESLALNGQCERLHPAVARIRLALGEALAL